MKLPAIILMTIFGYVPGDPILDFVSEVETSAPVCSAPVATSDKQASIDNTEGINHVSTCKPKNTCNLQAVFNNTNMRSGTVSFLSLADIIEFKYLTCTAPESPVMKGPVAI